MKSGLLTATVAAAALLAYGAQAAPTTVYNTELGSVPAPGSTTTGPTGTTSTNSVDASASRVSETLALGEWQQRNIGGDGVVGITTNYARSGNGSIFFSTVDGNSKADMEIHFAPVLLSDFTSASYDWYRDPSSTLNPAPAPSFRLELQTAAGAYGGYLVYEPYENGTVPVGSWETELINTTGSMFWSTNVNLLFPTPCGGSRLACLHTLSDWSSANVGAKVVGVSTGVGSGWSGGTFVGGVDNVNYTFGNSSQSFNFEVAAVPEPGTWALMITGFGLAGAALRRRPKSALAA